MDRDSWQPVGRAERLEVDTLERSLGAVPFRAIGGALAFGVSLHWWSAKGALCGIAPIDRFAAFPRACRFHMMWTQFESFFCLAHLRSHPSGKRSPRLQPFWMHCSHHGTKCLNAYMT